MSMPFKVYLIMRDPDRNGVNNIDQNNGLKRREATTLSVKSDA
jgi:hypothetical protein